MLGKIKDVVRRFRIASLRQKGCGLADFESTGNVLILAPHPDDEAIGCGGLISRLCEAGSAPHVAILSGGGKSLPDSLGLTEETVISERRKLSLNSAKALGLPSDHVHFFDFKDGSISPDSSETERLKSLIENLKPTKILVPHNGEGWPDHLAARNIGLKLAPQDAQVWEYCVWFWYYNSKPGDWSKARKITMSAVEHAKKNAAIDAYVLPEAKLGYPWSGNLPKIFVEANRGNVELYIRI